MLKLESIDHIHDVLSAVLRSGMKWGHLAANPAHGVEMPRLKTVRPKGVLTVDQALTLFEHLPVAKATHDGRTRAVAWSPPGRVVRFQMAGS